MIELYTVSKPNKEKANYIADKLAREHWLYIDGLLRHVGVHELIIGTMRTDYIYEFKYGFMEGISSNPPANMSANEDYDYNSRTAYTHGYKHGCEQYQQVCQ